MPKSLSFLHTSPIHIASFEGLLAELAPTVLRRHVVDEKLLEDARSTGMTAELRQRIAHRITELVAEGAGVVLCTCSTIGAAAEQSQPIVGCPVIRVDRPMVEQAVTAGERILLVAALASTLAPTRQLIQELAAQQARSIHIQELLCEHAWQHFERGDQAAYLSTIASAIHRAAPQADVVILAQASMSGASQLCADLSIPILSSPRLGLAAALSALGSTNHPSPNHLMTDY